MESLFNNPKHSDVIVNINNNAYHLISTLLEKQSPFFSREFAKIDFPESVNVSKTNDVELFLTGKKIITIDNDLKEDAILKVLRYMYGVTIGNITIDVADVIIKFEIIELMTICCRIWKKQIFIDHYLVAIISQSTLLPILEKFFKENITTYKNINGIIEKMPLSYFISILSSSDLDCDEDFRYFIADHYGRVNSNSCVMRYIKLSLLSKKVLITHAGNNLFTHRSRYIEALENHYVGIGHISRKMSDKPLFVIGKYGQQYEDYEVVTNYEKIKEKFVDQYRSHGGIVSIDYMKVGFLCTDKNIFMLHREFLKKDEYYVRKGDIVPFDTDDDSLKSVIKHIFYVKISQKEISEIKNDHTHNVSLFMRKS